MTESPRVFCGKKDTKRGLFSLYLFFVVSFFFPRWHCAAVSLGESGTGLGRRFQVENEKSIMCCRFLEKVWQERQKRDQYTQGLKQQRCASFASNL